MAVLIQRSEKYEEYRGDGDPCVICGKPVKQDGKSHWIRLGGGGSYAVTNAEAAADPAGDLGAYPVGPTCWRKHPELHALENGEEK